VEVERPVTVRVSAPEGDLAILAGRRSKDRMSTLRHGPAWWTVPLDASGHGAGVLRVAGRKVAVTQRINGGTEPRAAPPDRICLGVPTGWVCSPESVEVTPAGTDIEFRVVRAE
jgi:hypothetical protein